MVFVINLHFITIHTGDTRILNGIKIPLELVCNKLSQTQTNWAIPYCRVISHGRHHSCHCCIWVLSSCYSHQILKYSSSTKNVARIQLTLCAKLRTNQGKEYLRIDIFPVIHTTSLKNDMIQLEIDNRKPYIHVKYLYKHWRMKYSTLYIDIPALSMQPVYSQSSLTGIKFLQGCNSYPRIKTPESTYTPLVTRSCNKLGYTANKLVPGLNSSSLDMTM